MTTRIAVLGGGPAGLYAAWLWGRARPTDEVRLWERRAPGSSDGYGLIFGRTALAALGRTDPKLAAELNSAGVWFGMIRVQTAPSTAARTAPGFVGVHRSALLDLLYRRCRAVGVDLMHRQDAPDPLALAATHDLVIVADGASSLARARIADRLGSSEREVGVPFAWLSTRVPHDALTFRFGRSAGGGTYLGHVYPYGCGESTLLVEDLSAEGSAAAVSPDALVGSLFPGDAPRAVIGNNDGTVRWRAFRAVTNERWSTGNVVLVGDAAHTTHYSIGSGTKLALDDAWALVDVLLAAPDLASGLASYEACRRPVVERAQHVAETSREWFAAAASLVDRQAAEVLPTLITRGGRLGMHDLMLADGLGLPAPDGPGVL